MATAGSIKRLDVFGISYEVVGDAEPTLKPSVEKEAKATSGDPIIDSTKMVPQMEGITVALTLTQHDDLDQAAADNETGPLAMTNADGKTWRGNGQIAVGDYNAKASTAELTLIPRGRWANI